VPNLKRMTYAIWGALMIADRDTGWFCARFGSSWRTRCSDLRLYLEANYGLTVRTYSIHGSACKVYSIEEMGK
jgi:hypothetical protein